jgi:ubiquinone/menaquinone biosynthesis C-methylase UbiE
MRTQALFERYYFNRASFVGGTQIFHQMCQSHLRNERRILEIGTGPANPTSLFLSQIGTVTGLDVSNEVLSNPNVAEAHIYDGITMPYPDEVFDMCISNYVLEHVTDPLSHFRETFRVLRSGGTYCFRTPNLWHYVTIGSKLLPHSAHLRMANRLRALEKGAHDPWPTVYRANTSRQLRFLAKKTGWLVDELRMIEGEPCYGAAHAFLFYPMMAYERFVNSSELFASLRVNILGAFRKPMPLATGY